VIGATIGHPRQIGHQEQDGGEIAGQQMAQNDQQHQEDEIIEDKILETGLCALGPGQLGVKTAQEVIDDDVADGVGRHVDDSIDQRGAEANCAVINHGYKA